MEYTLLGSNGRKFQSTKQTYAVAFIIHNFSITGQGFNGSFVSGVMWGTHTLSMVQIDTKALHYCGTKSQITPLGNFYDIFFAPLRANVALITLTTFSSSRFRSFAMNAIFGNSYDFSQFTFLQSTITNFKATKIMGPSSSSLISAADTNFRIHLAAQIIFKEILGSIVRMWN